MGIITRDTSFIEGHRSYGHAYGSYFSCLCNQFIEHVGPTGDQFMFSYLQKKNHV